MRDIITKTEIEEIVVKNFYDLGYKEKYSKDYYIDLVDTVFKQINWDDVLVKTEDINNTDDSVDENEDTVIDEEKTYSHKPHLASLPHDRSSHDINELIDRFDACTRRMNESEVKIAQLKDSLYKDYQTAEKHKAELNKSLEMLGSMAKDNQAFYDADDKVRKEKSDWLDRIIKRVNEESDFLDLPYEVFEDLSKLRKNYFKNEDTSWVEEGDESDFYDLADKISKWRYSVEEDDTEWGNRMDGLADDIMVLASNDYFDKDLPKLHDKSHGLGELLTVLDNVKSMDKTVNEEFDSLAKQSKELEKASREYMDYKDESLKTVKRAGKLGLLD